MKMHPLISSTRFRLGAAVAALALALMARPASGHGRLVDPPSRASAWRFGFDTPHNYNDHELYCGGYSRQWNKNGGNCGICGDPWDEKPPRAHEYGGKYGKGPVVRKYRIGSTVEIRVQLTANHNGYFEFRICPFAENATQECLDENVLELRPRNATGGAADTKYYPGKGNKMFSMLYALPEGLVCDRCVLQWRYIAGNNWGTCPDGSGAVGCGPQEEFRACADVAVLYDVDADAGSTFGPRPPYVLPTRTTSPKTTDGVELPPEAPLPSDGDRAWVGILVSVLTLFLVVLSLGLFYFYYYRGGYQIKNLLLKKNLAVSPPPPVRPPRTKKIAAVGAEDDAERVGLDADDGAEPGFETIRLGDAKY